MKPAILPLLFLALAFLPLVAAAAAPLPGTLPLDTQGDLAEEMVAGIDRFLTRETEAAATRRPGRWKRDFSSAESYTRSLEPNRQRLRKILGAVDARVPFGDLELVAGVSGSALV